MKTVYFWVALFLAMIVFLIYFVATNEQELLENSYNSRQQILAERNYRGTIYSKDGDILAYSTSNKNGQDERDYPYGSLFSHVVGYSANGRMGIESLTNYYLINSNISALKKAENQSNDLKNPGDNVYTTLDVNLQQVADAQLNIYRGAVIVTEVKTGKILAMVSHPNFDPNDIENIWEDLAGDDSSSVLVNRATQGLYPPGSTFKIVTALEYIRENPTQYLDYHYQCNGSFQTGESKINCYHGISHGAVDFTLSFAKSCNSSFANIGMTLEKESFKKTLEEMLFSQDLPIDFVYSKSAVEISEELNVNEMMQTSIGQGKTQITPIHLNMITSAIANDGVLMSPYLVDHVESADGEIVKSFKPQTYQDKLMSTEEAQILQQMMEAVVEEGTASKLKGLSYSAAGKTGSAEYNNVKGDSHAWFTGYAPAEDPEICVTIIVEGAGSGGDYAVPIARRIFDAYFGEE